MPVPSPFPYKTQPLPKQREILRLTAGRVFAFLAMETGTGKSFVSILTAAYLWFSGKIDAIIIIAPNGVHMGWALEQLPQHMPDPVPWRAHIWRSGKERGWWHKRLKEPEQEWALSTLAQDTSVLAILCINTDAITTPLGHKAIGTFLTRRRCLMIVDESGDFTSPGAKRTKRLLAYRDRAPYRRALDGTPIGVNGPLELYAPCKFLSPTILGVRNFYAMREEYAELEDARWDVRELKPGQRRQQVIAVDRETGKKKWKNLDKLAEKLRPHMIRVTKREMDPELPPKIFDTRYFELTDEQWRLTLELMENLTANLEGGGTVTAQSVLTQYLRYQQIACGYVPPDEAYIGIDEDKAPEPMHIIPGPNPRMEAAVEELLKNNHVQSICWTRFQLDIDLLRSRFDMEGITYVVYDGRCTLDEKEEAKRRFKAGEVQNFLGNPAAGGRGLNLPEAEFVLYYANYFGLRRRLQSEDRAHRIIGTTRPVNYRDLCGYRSIDTLIIRALRNNQEVADTITGDPAKDWI